MSNVRLGERWFEVVWNRNLVYNACWEDPRLDRVALQLEPTDTVLVITSAGCNALDYALLGPRAVHAVDLNPRQNALLELKRAAIRELEFGEFFGMFGRGRLGRPRDVYEPRLRRHLSPAARAYWDGHIHFFDAAHASFYFNGTTGLVARAVNFYIDRVARVRAQVDRLLEAHSLDEQQATYERDVRDRFWRPLLRRAVGSRWLMALLGVPADQHAEVERDHMRPVDSRFVRRDLHEDRTSTLTCR